jgi:hypothetical protein
MFWMCFTVGREREVTDDKERGALDCWESKDKDIVSI